MSLAERRLGKNEQKRTQDGRFASSRARAGESSSNRSPNRRSCLENSLASSRQPQFFTSGARNMRLRRASKLIFPEPKIKQ